MVNESSVSVSIRRGAEEAEDVREFFEDDQAVAKRGEFGEIAGGFEFRDVGETIEQADQFEEFAEGAAGVEIVVHQVEEAVAESLDTVDR